MRDEEVAYTITKKLRVFTLVERDAEMILDSVFAREQFLSYEIYDGLRRLDANGPAYPLVDCSRTRDPVDSRSTAVGSFQFSNNRIAQVLLKELRNNKQIRPCLLCFFVAQDV